MLDKGTTAPGLSLLRWTSRMGVSKLLARVTEYRLITSYNNWSLSRIMALKGYNNRSTSIIRGPIVRIIGLMV